MRIYNSKLHYWALSLVSLSIVGDTYIWEICHTTILFILPINATYKQWQGIHRYWRNLCTSLHLPQHRDMVLNHLIFVTPFLCTIGFKPLYNHHRKSMLHRFSILLIFLPHPCNILIPISLWLFMGVILYYLMRLRINILTSVQNIIWKVHSFHHMH